MATEAERVTARRVGSDTITRIALVAVGVAACAWATDAGRVFFRQTGFSDVAARIIAGDTYKPDAMDALASQITAQEQSLRPSLRGKIAVFRLRQAENAIPIGDPHAVDQAFDTLSVSVDEALRDAPSEPFLWLVRYWLDNARDGFSAEHLRYLRVSYVLGPNEGWIAVRRNIYALAIFPELPPDLARAAIDELTGLVRSGLFEQAATTIARADPPLRKALVAPLAALPAATRSAFAKILDAREIDDVTVPGIEPPPLRPWH
jgi:hypothetical protein